MRSSGVPRNFVRGRGSTSSVEDRGQRERGSGGYRSGVPRNFVGGGVQQVQLRTERTGITLGFHKTRGFLG